MAGPAQTLALLQGVGFSLALLGVAAAASAEPAATTAMPQLPSGLSISPHARRLLLAAMGEPTAPRGGLRPASRSGEPLLPLIVSAWGGAAALERAGIAARELSQSFAAVTLPASKLSTLWQLPGLLRVDGSRTLHPRLDRSVPYIGATTLRDAGLSGRGVMIATIDTGIDFRHLDFRNEDGSSRIAFLIDATTPRGNLHPELPDTADMAVYTKDDLDALLSAEAQGKQPPRRIAEADTSGHGTHVAGIAAGNGRGTGNRLPAGRYVGVAPGATLCAVKATRNDQDFADMDILVGVRFCLERARVLHMPVVVNLSLGSGGGPHDGTSALELALDELIADQPGRALVAAAGNSGTEDIHASGRLAGGSHEIPIQIKQGDGDKSGQSSLVLEVFFDTAVLPSAGEDAPGHITMELRSPAGKVLRASPGQSNRGEFPGEGVGIIDNSDDTMTGRRGALMLLRGKDALSGVKAGEWKLTLRGSTLRYDVWQVESSSDLEVKLLRHLDPDGYVEIPSAARSAISVGAMRTRADWLRVDGKLVTFERELLRVAPFSSGGPTSDGRFAPDLLAPGEFIISTLSSAASPSSERSVFYSPGDPEFLVADDGAHAVLRGTSQAAPHVAGAIALLFELDPDLTGTHVRELLRTTTRTDPASPSYGPRRGFGTLDLNTALTAMRGSPPLFVDALSSDLGSNFDAIPAGVGQAVITVTPRDPRGVPLGPGLRVDVLSDAGDWLGPTVDTGFGRYERVLLARGPRGTLATVQARVGEKILARTLSIHFVDDASEIGGRFELGGCSFTGTATGKGRAGEPLLGHCLWLLGLFGLLLLRRGAAGRIRAAASLLLLGGCGPAEPLQSSAFSVGADAKVVGASRARRFPPGGDYYWQGGEALAQPAVVVHLKEQFAEIFDGGKLLARSSVCSGRRSHPTPTGHFTVLEKVPEHVSSRYGDYVDESGQVVRSNIDNSSEPPPPGTVFRGTKMPFFLRIVGGVGLHEGPLPGHPDSHGCIRLPPLIAQRLFYAVSVGTPVAVED